MSKETDKEPFVHPSQLNRRSGRTTRAIDEMVQHLFNHGIVQLWDHANRIDWQDKQNMALREAKRIFFDRLSREHRLTIKHGLNYDQKTETVRLSNQPNVNHHEQ